MACVWLARPRSEDTDLLVAIKTILPDYAANDEFRTMMLDEARIVSSIDHPNVACILEVAQLWDVPYLVLEYVAGESLDQLSDALAHARRTVPPAIVARLMADTCAGLHAAHELTAADGSPLGIVHRDLSPQNILVDGLGHVKLIDFGVAKAAERLTTETASGVMKGKVPYMAPEHARGGAVDRRADIWSLGAVAYVLLSGMYPFDGANDSARIIRKLVGEPPAPLPDTVPEAMREVVLRALAHEPEGRYATAKELGAAFESSVSAATTEEVAAFFAENLASCVESREATVRLALAGAALRARTRELLQKRSTAPSRPIMTTIPPGEEEPSGSTLESTPPPRSRLRLAYVAAGVVAVVFFMFGVGFFSRKPSGTIASSGADNRHPDPVTSVEPSASPAMSISAPASAPVSVASLSPQPSGRPSTLLFVKPAPSIAPSSSAKPIQPEDTIF